MPLVRSIIHISEPTRQAEISYAVFCLKNKTVSSTKYFHFKMSSSDNAIVSHV